MTAHIEQLKDEHVFADAVYEHPAGLDVTIALTYTVSRQCVVTIFFRKRFFTMQHRDHFIERAHIPTACETQSQMFLERARLDDLKHWDLIPQLQSPLRSLKASPRSYYRFLRCR